MSARGRNKAKRARATGRWIAGVVVLAVAACCAFWGLNRPAAVSGPEPQRLAGHWLRPDGDYLLQLSDPQPSGELRAAYLNPRPIHGAKSTWSRVEGGLRVFIELRDVNYPGSTYTLTYEPISDRLSGNYFQAALGQ